MRSIWFWGFSLSVVLTVWWTTTEHRREAAKPRPALSAPARSVARVNLLDEYQGEPGDLSSIRTDLKTTPTQLRIRSMTDAPQSATLTVEISQSNLYLQATPTNGSLEQNTLVTRIDDQHYRVDVRVADGLGEGNYNGYLQLQACVDAGCSDQVTGGKAYVAYQIEVQDPAHATLGEWETFQRDAGHSGYVPARFLPRSFAYKWEWHRPTTGTLGFINAVTTAPGLVFVSDDEYSGSPALRALREGDGGLVWLQTFTNFPALSPPASANNKVYVATTGHQQTFLWAFNAQNGMAVFQNSFASQWAHVLSPTVRDGRVYTNGGYYGGGVYAYDDTLGDLQWSMFSGDDDMTTPAVDGSRVYYYDGTGLVTYDTATGTKLSSTPDPYSPAQGYSHHGAPMLGLPDSITTFSGGAFSGRASSSVEQYDTRPLINFSVAGNTTRWRTTRKYMTQPAAAKGIVYAGSNAPKSFDAIDEATGKILWSWVPQPPDTEFHRNVVVTDNLAFVSTNLAVYAIDLTTHEAVWRYPAPGMLSISGGGTLYIVEGAREPTGRLIAIALK